MTAPVNRPLTAAERTLLCQLAIRVVSEQTGSDADAVADALDEMGMVIRADAQDAYVEADGKVLVHVTREWLSFNAAYPSDQPVHGERIERRGE